MKQNVSVDDRQEARCRSQAVGESLHAIGQLLQPSCLHRRGRVDQFDGSWAALRQAVNLPVPLVVKVVPGERIHEDVAACASAVPTHARKLFWWMETACRQLVGVEVDDGRLSSGELSDLVSDPWELARWGSRGGMMP